MKLMTILLSCAGVLALASCNAPYGAGVEQMVPRANVEEVERQGSLAPAPSNGLDGFTATQYARDNRYGGFHGYGRNYHY